MNRTALAAVAAVCAFAATPAAAADFSYSGTMTDPNDVLLFHFTATGSSTVTLVSYSYAGGTQADGNVVSAGGFDPLLALYAADGTFLGTNDDGSSVVDPSTGNSWDVLFSSMLAAGNYTVALTSYPQIANGTALNLADLGAAFNGTGSFNGRSGTFAFDLLGVSTATGPGAVPEPGTWAMMLLGFGAIGYSMRKRPALRVQKA